MSNGTSTSDESRNQNSGVSEGQNPQNGADTSEPEGGPIEDAESQPTDRNDQELNVDDPLFTQRKGIFRNKEMVRVGWVPDGDRIVGRDGYISTIASCPLWLNSPVVDR